MTYALRFLPEIVDDVMAGYAWYEEKALGLGEEFLRMAYACASELPQNPLMYPKVYGEFRRRLLRRFPYGVYFGIKEHEVIVFGVFHCARDPRTVQESLQDRGDPENP